MNTSVENILLKTLGEGKCVPLHNEAEAWRQSVRDFATEVVKPKAKMIDDGQLLPRTIINALFEKKYLGYLVSGDYGGSAGDYIRYGALCEELGRVCTSTRSLLTVHDMVCHALGRWGSEEQKQKWLPQLVSGALIGAFCLSESEVGSDASSVSTMAVRVNDGYLLTGVKKWITFGQIADLLLVIARYEGKPTAFIVERETAGLSCKPIQGLLGMRGAMLAEIHLDDCFINGENLLGRVGVGVSCVATTALQVGRYNVAFGSVGIGQACLESCAEYAQSRTQFGVPIKKHQLIQRMITDMLVDVRGARLLCNQAGYALAINSPTAMIQVMEAKYVASRAASRAANDAVQLHGANGCSDDFPVSRLFRDAKVMEIIEGSNEINQISIANHSASLLR